jgi:hypothetical protein
MTGESATAMLKGSEKPDLLVKVPNIILFIYMLLAVLTEPDFGAVKDGRELSLCRVASVADLMKLS